MSISTIIAAIIIIITLVGVAVGSYPWLRMNRATIALVGATLLIIIGAIPLEKAYASIDLNTITLLFAMMIINANLRLAGFFRLAGSALLPSTPTVISVPLMNFSTSTWAPYRRADAAPLAPAATSSSIPLQFHRGAAGRA